MNTTSRGGWKDGGFADARERFIAPETELNDVPVSAFWQWAYSSLLTDTVRGILAEFIVARLVGGHIVPQTPWQRWDVLMPADVRIEVKSSAYLNTWNRPKVAKTIGFSGLMATIFPPIHDGDAVPQYHSHVFVFCLLATKDWGTIDPLDVKHWEFYVVPVNRLRAAGSPKSVSLRRVQALAVGSCAASDLKDAVTRAYQEAIASGFVAPRKDDLPT